MEEFVLPKLSSNEKADALFKLNLLKELCCNVETLRPEQVDLVERVFRQLTSIIPINREPVSNGYKFPFVRTVINEAIVQRNARLHSLENLRYPPLNMKDLPYNRANLKGQSVFYGASHSFPAIVETKPKEGQLITISDWEIIHGCEIRQFVVCQDSEIAAQNDPFLLDRYNEHLRMLYKLDADTLSIIDGIYDFIVQAFTKVVNPKNKQGYLISALFADHILNHGSPKVDAIIYPSVAFNNYTLNIAVTPECLNSCFKMTEAKEMLVTQSLDQGDAKWFGVITGRAVVDPDIPLRLNWQNEPIARDEMIGLSHLYDFSLE